MTQGLVRYQNSVDFHFVTFSCYGRQPYFGLPEVRDLFECSLERIRKRYNFFVFGCVVMPEHVHLLVSEPENAGLQSGIRLVEEDAEAPKGPSGKRPFSAYDAGVKTPAYLETEFFAVSAFPRRLKPCGFDSLYGVAEATPFQSGDFFRMSFYPL